MYKKIVNKGSPDFCYLKIRLDFEEDQNFQFDVVNFKQIILQAVNSLFGLSVSCDVIDILQYEKSDRSAILRVRHNNVEKIWASLTLYSQCNNVPCAFRVLQISPHLLSLAGNSREMVIHVVDD